MSEKRFFIDKIDNNQYAVYDRLKVGYIEPLVYTDWTVGLDYTQSVCDLFNDCDEKMNEVYEKLIIGKGSSEVIDMIKFGDNLYGVTIKELFDRNKKLEENIDNEKNDYRELFSNYIYLQEKNVKLIEENEQLDKENKKLQEEIEELKRERDDWKSSTCSYMNKDSLLSMDCQIVQEALWELEKEIEFGSKREDLFFDLKEKFEKLNNHRIGVFDDE